MLRRFSFVSTLCLFVLLTLAACQREPVVIRITAEPPEPTEPAPTQVAVQPTATATATATATSLPDPTATPTAVPDVLSAFVDTDVDWRDFPVDGALVIRFNQPMNPESSVVALRFVPHISGAYVWNEDHTAVTFTPRDTLTPDTRYEVTIPRQLETADGKFFTAAEAPRWILHTDSPPQVVGFTPHTRTITDLAVQPQIIFSDPVDVADVADALTLNPPVSYDLVQLTDEVLQIQPKKPFKPGMALEIVLDDTAVTRAGESIQATDWTYELPSYYYLKKHPGRYDFGLSGDVEIAFNYPVTEEAILDRLVLSPTVPISATWNDMARVMTLMPAEGRWPGNTPLQISLSGLDDLLTVGNTAVAITDTLQVPPLLPILSAQPQGDVLLAQRIEIVFDRLMDEEATANAFSIHPPVSGTIRWEETALIFEPDPDDGFASQTEYFVQLDDTVRDAEGNEMLPLPQGWSFSTGRFDDFAAFGYGPNIQALTTDGRRAVHYVLWGSEVGLEIPVDLYRMDKTQFLDRYSSGFRGVNEWQKKAIDFTDLELVAQWTTTTTEAIQSYTNVQELLVPADVPPGFYVLNLGQQPALTDQILVVISPYTIVSKYVGNQIFNWVTDAEGNPAVGIDVGVYTRGGERLGGGATDENGVHVLNIGLQDPAPLLAVAEEGDNFAATGFTFEWKHSGPGSWWRPNLAINPASYAVYAYTDRPLYKPGQTMYYKAIVREDDDALLSNPPENTAVTVRIRDARNNVVRTTQETLNEFGMVHGEFAIAEGAMLGDYLLEIELPATAVRAAYRTEQVFKVEDYRKPDYQIELEVSDTRLVHQSTMTVTGEVNYFFGEPVANAEVSVDLFRITEYWSWDSESPEQVWNGAPSPEFDVKTDEDGRFSFTYNPVLPEWDAYDYSWRSNIKVSDFAVQVSVADESAQPVSSFRKYRVFSADTKLGIRPEGYFHQPGDAIPITATAVDLYDQPRANQELTLQLTRWRSGDGYTDVRQETTLVTGADGRVQTTINVTEPGYYRLRLLGTDSSGQEVESYSWVYVFNREFSSWWGTGNSSRLSLARDKESYAPGDVAQIVVETELDGPALLTLERGSVRDEQMVQLTSPVTVLEIPIQPEYAPNIFVTLTAWDENDTNITEEMYYSEPDLALHTAVVELSVPATDKQLQVEIVSDRDVYAPRDDAVFTLRVTNPQGEPVSAEFSLAVVDEAIFALSDDLSGPIYDAFYYDRDHLVRTYHAFRPERELGGGGRGGGGGDGGVFGSPRSDFPDTAAWYHTLRTDANGEAQIRMPLPDTLTSWRLTAKGATADTQVGEAIHNITVRQDIVVRPLLPRVLTTGDTVMLSTIVQNFGQEAVTFDVWVDVAEETYLQIEKPEMPKYTLQPGQTRVVGWQATAVGAGLATITVAAAQDGDVLDSVQLPLPIQPLAVPDVATQVGDFRGQVDLTFDLPADALPSSGVQLELSRSIAGTMLDGLDYLTGFPYGCVEQTMSRALPNAVVGRAFNQLGIANPTLMADLPPKINASIQRLYGYQHTDGGWGWWYDDDSDHYQTAWVVFGLVNTAEAGYEIDPVVIERGVVWLAEELPQMDERTRAYALYTMALAFDYDPVGTVLRDPENNEEFDIEGLVVENLLGLSLLPPDELAELGTFSQASVALGLHTLGETEAAQTVLQYLTDTAVEQDALVYWEGDANDGYYSQKTMASDLRSTAHALSAFSRIAPGHPLQAGIVRYLLANRTQDGWGTTNETSFAIIGLTDHLLATEFSDGEATSYTVSLNGAEVFTGELGQNNPSTTLTLYSLSLQTGENNLTITQSGAGVLYYTLNRTAYVPQAEIEAAGSLQVSRRYTAVGTNRTITNTAVGELVEVILTINADAPVAYAIIEDKLPGGFEALNERLNNTAHIVTRDINPNEPQYGVYGYNYKEVRGDRVSFFITDMRQGTTVIRYVMRATRPGEFVALPATVSAMYDFTQWGRSASTTFRVNAD